jgi:hypothetical protein
VQGVPRASNFTGEVEQLKAYLAGYATALEEVNAELHELEVPVFHP